MDYIQDNVKIKSKFFKILEDYNFGSVATPSGAAPGAAPGTLPTSPQPGAAITQPQGAQQQQPVDLKLKKAQDDAARAAIEAAKVELQTLQSRTNSDQQRAKQLQDIISGKAQPQAPITAV